MGKKKHQFISKKSAHKFNVVHRSQRDPLQPDEESSQHVLVPVGGMSHIASSSVSHDDREELVKFGVFYDDDYDYLQHLRPRGEGMLIMAEDPTERNISPQRDDSFRSLNLPAEVLPSKYEEDIGMLNKGVLPRGPQPDWDPDIVAALDDDVDFDDPDNMLQDDFIDMANAEMDSKGNCYSSDDIFEDNFVMMANSIGGMEENINNLPDKITKSDEEWETDSNVSSTGNFDSDDLSGDEYSEEETKSRFTNYSMTSSVIRRTEGLKILDDHFEHIMEEYDEEEIGAIDHEETTGAFNVNNELISQIVEEFIDQQKKAPLSEAVNEDRGEIGESDSDQDIENDNQLFEIFEGKTSEKWDCESIISTYSNIYNHPKLIDEPKMIKLHKKTGVPLGVFNDKQNKESGTVDTEELSVEHVTLNNIRKKGETPEEKRNRKLEVKEQRKDRRKEKKENKLVFKDEHKKLEQIAINKSNQMGIKI